MKRAATSSSSGKSKKTRIEVPEYHLTPSVRDEQGQIQWPAPRQQLEAAKTFILEWYVYLPWNFENTPG